MMVAQHENPDTEEGLDLFTFAKANRKPAQ